MADIFDEVGEDLRREQLKRLWQRHGWLLIALAVAVVAATAGWRIYDHFNRTAAAEAGARFEAALAEAREGADPLAAAVALEAFASGAPASYAALARFRAASEHAIAGETDNALAAFDRLAADGGLPQEMRDMAAIRAAMIAVDRESPDAIKARVGRFDTDADPWRFSAREIMALAAIRAEAYEEARSHADRIVGDAAAPRGIAARAQIIQAVVTAAIGAPAKAEGAGS